MLKSPSYALVNKQWHHKNQVQTTISKITAKHTCEHGVRGRKSTVESNYSNAILLLLFCGCLKSIIPPIKPSEQTKGEKTAERDIIVGELISLVDLLLISVHSYKPRLNDEGLLLVVKRRREREREREGCRDVGLSEKIC